MTDEAVRITLSAGVQGCGDIAYDGSSWTILRALAHDVVTEQDWREHRISALRRKGPVLDTAT